MKKIKIFILYSFCFIFLLCSCNSNKTDYQNTQIHGYVKSENNLVNNAVVRMQATDNSMITDKNGFFILSELPQDKSIVITAWAEGHYIGSIEAIPSSEPITIQLSKYNTTDNPNYDWIPDEGGVGSIGCSECHPAYDEWLNDAHSQSAVNPRFLSMYNGTDFDGNKSPQTEYGFNRDYGSFPLLPDTTKPYFGPGYKLDFQETAGNCATCHVPAQAAHPGFEYSANPNLTSGIEKEGIFCDFCHKIGNVSLNTKTLLPNPNMPGILSIKLLRPEEGGEDIFLGNLDDVVGPDSYLPLYEESEYCAPCHFGTFWDTTVYNSYGEWLDSSYSDPDTGQTCQECHMPPVDYEYFVYQDKGGVKRDPDKIFDHNMTGFMEDELMQNAVSLEVDAITKNDLLNLVINVTNDKTGHDVPTDFPLRQVVLVIDVLDEEGNKIELSEGEIIPFYGGEGNPKLGYYAGQPGKIFMKVLQELWTEVYPTGSYWNPTRTMSDNRLSPFETDTSAYTFDISGSKNVIVNIRLLFRRATKELMDQKGWDVPDILMEEINLIMEN